MKKRCMLLAGITLILLSLAGCTSVSNTSLAQKPSVIWEEWKAEGAYADYANLHKRFADRTKFATITVPLDYENPTAGTIDVAVLKVEARNKEERWGSILFNPGGPGGDGLIYGLLFSYLWSEDYPLSATGAGTLFQEVAEHYDLVGFSPRGLGASTNLICSSDALLEPALILSADGSEANLAANQANASAIAEACLANPMTNHINTEATARDMDVIREALGDEKLNFMGISYGTWLGTWYASLFPQRVGKLLLIGQTDITQPLNGALLVQEMGMQRVLETKLIPHVATYPHLFHLGFSVAEVRQNLSSLEGWLKHATMKALDEHISYSGQAMLALFTLRSALVINTLLENEPDLEEEQLHRLLAQYDWQVDEESSAVLLQKGHMLAEEYYALKNRQREPVEVSGSDAVWWAVQSMDTNTLYDRDSWLLQNALHIKQYPEFGGFYIENPALYWDKAPVNRPAIESIPQDASILIVQSEYDPYTPLESAVRTFSALEQASMIVLEGEYQHCILLPYGNEILDRSVAEFFLENKQPPRLTLVEGHQLPTYE